MNMILRAAHAYTNMCLVAKHAACTQRVIRVFVHKTLYIKSVQTTQPNKSIHILSKNKSIHKLVLG